MCSNACLNFALTQIKKADVEGKRVLEVGSYNVNGSFSDYVKTLDPAEYIGVDMTEGPCVDQVVNSEELVKEFGKNSFDLVITTEMLEHVVNWKAVVKNLKEVLKPGGLLVITTRSDGFPYHEWPIDSWRYEVADMQEIFDDFNPLHVEPDPFEPGVFVRATKPAKGYKARSLEGIKLLSTTLGKRV
jgi:2-polyprenyl-3-methyl-5-hydroxy-6-metoxy-1,4-benzoquinol methylase